MYLFVCWLHSFMEVAIVCIYTIYVCIMWIRRHIQSKGLVIQTKGLRNSIQRASEFNPKGFVWRFVCLFVRLSVLSRFFGFLNVPEARAHSRVGLGSSLWVPGSSWAPYPQAVGLCFFVVFQAGLSFKSQLGSIGSHGLHTHRPWVCVFLLFFRQAYPLKVNWAP